MTNKEKAKLLSEHCVDQICSLGDCDDAEMVAKLCCLVELFEVVRAARFLYGEINVHGGHGTPTFDDRAVCYSALNDFEIALAALRAKLPKDFQP